jgi:alkylation response protein AidB-like acyl-CoA dehydrogenase
MAVGKVIQSDEQAMAVDGLRRSLPLVDPLFSKDYRDRFMPRDVMAGLMRRLSDFGLVSGVVSPAAGGLGLDWLTSLMLFEEVAACSVDLGAGADQRVWRLPAGTGGLARTARVICRG